MSKRTDIRAIFDNEEMDKETKVSKILDLIHAEVDAVRDEKDDLQKELDKVNNDLKSANAAKEQAEKELGDYKEAQTQKETRTAKESAYTKLLKDAGIGEKHIKLILKATDFDGVDLDENGAIKEASKLTESIKADYADYIVKTGVKGANFANPPKSAGSGNTVTKESIMEIKDPVARQQAIADNHELFGI